MQSKNGNCGNCDNGLCLQEKKINTEVAIKGDDYKITLANFNQLGHRLLIELFNNYFLRIA